MKKNSKEMPIDSVVSIPDDIIIEQYDNGHKIVIAVKEARWLVLSSKHEEEMFDMLKSHQPISVLLDKYDEKEASILVSKVCASKISEEIDNEKMSELNNDCMYIYLTQGCNLRCKHCYMFSGTKLNNELSVEQWMKVLDAFKKAGGKSVTFSGGEPLLYHGFAEVVDYASSIGLIVGVLSNGMLWTDKLLNRLSSSINDIQISIDGVDEDSYNKVRINGDFNKVVENAIKIAKSGINLSIATTFTFDNLTEDTKKQYSSLVDRLIEETGKFIDFRLSKNMLNGRDVHYSEKENEAYYKTIKEIESSIDPEQGNINFIEGHTSPSHNCGIGGITVASNGDVYYCNRISEFACDGNILDTPMEYFVKRGEELNNRTSVDNIYPCKNCSVRYICGGDCRIDNFSIHGSDIQRPVYKKSTGECKKKIIDMMFNSFIKYYNF